MLSSSNVSLRDASELAIRGGKGKTRAVSSPDISVCAAPNLTNDRRSLSKIGIVCSRDKRNVQTAKYVLARLRIWIAAKV